jgi:hypothetical protein
MPARARHRIKHKGAQLIRQFSQLAFIKRLEIGRRMNTVKQVGGHMCLNFYKKSSQTNNHRKHFNDRNHFNDRVKQ